MKMRRIARHGRFVCARAVDVYSFGMLLYSLLTGRTPFADAAGRNLLPWQVMVKALVERRRPELPPGAPWPAELRTLIERCWDHDPERRPDIDYVVAALGR